MKPIQQISSFGEDSRSFMPKLPRVLSVFLVKLFLTMMVAAQSSIPIVNFGFEDPVVAEGDYFNGPNSGWDPYGPVIPVIFGVGAIVYNPDSSEFPAEAPQPHNVGAIYLNDLDVGAERGFVQTLSQNFEEGDSYQLSVEVGYAAYLFAAPGYRVQLLAGDTVIAEDDNSIDLDAVRGTFATSTVNYSYDVNDADLVGQPLGIRLINKHGVAGETEVAFDDVKLFAVLANPFADPGGPYYLADPVATLSLDGSASLPSGTGSISSYEWDLDNDGTYDLTGVTPAAISFSDLQSLYGMVDGSNPITIRVTDSDGNVAVAQGNVELVTSTKYTGVNTYRGRETWNTASNWDNGVPSGDLDVVILDGKNPLAWDDSTPTYTGNLTLRNNSRLDIGWTTQRMGPYNALGTPGISKIFMHPGSIIVCRMGLNPTFPEVQLLADATIVLGTSTQRGTEIDFDYPVGGPHRLKLVGNSRGNCKANFNVPNNFSSLLAEGSQDGVTIKANTFGSLGTGDVTIAKNTNNSNCYGILEINADNAMADTATLSISGNATTKLRMNANDTIAAFVIDGASQPAGTYGSTSSAATNQLSWITGSGILTVAPPSIAYWDLNGSTAGAGSTAPSGGWDVTNANWNEQESGNGIVSPWAPGASAVFSAGSDATGSYAIDVDGAQDVAGVFLRSGSVDLADGASGSLRLTNEGVVYSGSGSSAVSIPINEDASARSLTLLSFGELAVSGNLSQTGGTSVAGGNVTLSGDNSVATGNTTLSGGVLDVDSVASIPGTARNLTVEPFAALRFGLAFGSSNIQTALSNRIVTGSSGLIAADNYPAVDFDFNSAGLSSAYFGSLGNLNYAGVFTPQGSAYRLAGQGGTLQMANALSGGRTLTVRGQVELQSDNTYTGATTVTPYGALTLLGASDTSGITLNGANILTLGHNDSLGNGILTLSGSSALKAIGTVVTTNPVAANSDFSFGGNGALSLGPVTINNSRNISSAAAGISTIASIGRSNTSGRHLYLLGGGDITVTGGVDLGSGQLRKYDNGTATIGGSSVFGSTYIYGGTLRLDGSLASAANTEIQAGTLQLGGATNGGMATGLIDIRNSSAKIEAVSGDRSIGNDIHLNANVTFTGNHSLYVGGDLSNRADRTLTNAIAAGKSLTLQSLSLSPNSSNRKFYIRGSGDTIVSGTIQDGASTSLIDKGGSGAFIIDGNSTYGGTTVVNAGSLVVNGTSGSGNHSIKSGATLGGTGVIGGNITIDSGAIMEFDINSDAASHDKLEVTSGKTLTMGAGTTLKVTGVPDLDTPYILLSAPGGMTIPLGGLPTLDVSEDWVATLQQIGDDLVLEVSYTGVFQPDLDPPTFVSDGDVAPSNYIYESITYTVTFNQDMNHNSFSAADFGNATAGTAVISIDSITETSPGVFEIIVTPTDPGTLQFGINQGASLRSAAGANLNTTSAILDDTTLTISLPPNGVLSVTEGDFASSGFTGGPFTPVSKAYTLTNYGSQSVNWTAAETASWLNLDTTFGTLAAGASTVLTASIDGSASALPISPYLDVITFTNTTDGAGDTTRTAFLTVLGDPVDVTLVGLSQTYDGTPKIVTATTVPVGISYEVTYNGETEAPTTGGSYDVVATITNPLYSGTATGTLVIEKADQTITFGPLDLVGNDQTEIDLTATASSGLPVSFTSSDVSIATISDSTATIVDVGTTTITAYQDGDGNYNPAVSVLQDLEVFRAVPLADPGGPYVVEVPADFLVLDGGESIPSGEGGSITLYEWDLNVNDNGGVFNADVTGSAPAPISANDLLATYGMVAGTSNAIRLKVTDSATKTNIQSTTVYVTTPLLWDANAAGSGQTDGGGGWLSLNNWWTGSENVTYAEASGANVTFGNEGTAGTIFIAAPLTVGSMTFNDFSGTYDIGRSDGQALTINQGITKNVGQGDVQFSSPVILGGDQTWMNNSGTIRTYRHGTGTLDTNGHTLTFDGPGTIEWDYADITGSGALVKNGSSFLNLRSGNNTFSGGLTLNGGTIMVQNFNWGPGNVTINNGIFPCYWSGNLYRPLGDGPGEFRITGGVSGFGAGSGITLRFNNSTNYEVVWGDQYFNPEVFVVSHQTRPGSVNFDNKLDLNGANRTVSSLYYDPSRPERGSGRFSRTIRNSSTTPAGLIKVGPGLIHLNAANTFDGGVTVEDGTIQLGNVSGLGSSVGPVTINSGLINLYGMPVVSIGHLSGSGGTIANNRSSKTTELIIGNGGADGGSFQGVIANSTTGSGVVKLTKTGSGKITLSGANTYTGATAINAGKLIIDGSTAATNISVSSGATLGGNGSLGGNATVAAGGKLEFNISSDAASHDPMDFAGGKGLVLNGASELTITTSGGAQTGTYVLVTGGNNITGVVPATINLPLAWQASVSIVGNELQLVITDPADNVAPTLAGASIVDDQSGASVVSNSVVTYTVTFNEDMDASTVSAADFANDGTAGVTIGSVVGTANPAEFLVEATPTSIGSLRLQVNAGAHLADLTGNSLDTSLAIIDDTTISVLDSLSAPVVGISGQDQQYVSLVDVFWTPTSISTVAWYDASNADSITDDGSGNVTNWNDLSGNGIHLSQSNTDKRPVTGTHSINGLNTLDFDENPADNLIASSKTLHDKVYVVARSDGMPYDGRPTLLGGTSSAYTVQFVGNGSTNPSDWNGGSYYQNGSSTRATNGEAKDVVTETTLIRRDASYGEYAVCVGADRQINKRSWDGRIAEVIYLNRALSDDLRNVEGYLMWKWGLQDNLPSGHIHKNQAPGTTEVTVDLSATATDDDPMTYSWSVISGPGNVYFDDASARDASATFSQTGTYVLRLTAFNGTSTGYDEVTVHVVVDNDVPTLAGADIVDDRSGAAMGTNEIVNYTVTFSEPMDINSIDADDFTNAGTAGIYVGAITEVTPNIFNVAVVPTTQGTLQLQVPAGATLTDLVGNALDTGGAIIDDTIIQVNTGVSNNPPVFVNDPIQGIGDATEDVDYATPLQTLVGSATDADTDPLTYSKHSGPDWLIVNGDGTLGGTPSNDDVGLNSFIIRVSDNKFIYPVEATLNITVTNTNDAPYFNGDPVVGTNAAEDSPYSGDLNALVTEPDVDDTLTFVKISGPAWLNVAADGSLSGTPGLSDVGTDSYSISVTDGIIPTPIVGNLEITVVAVNDAPVVDAGPDQYINLTPDPVPPTLAWTTYAPWTNDADSGISSANTYTATHSFGTRNGGSVTVNGVNFPENYNSSGLGWSIGGSQSRWDNDDDANFTNGTGSEKLAKSFVYNGNPRTVTFTGLTPGRAYEANFFSVAWENGGRTQTFEIDGGSSQDIAQSIYNNNNGIRITATYTATTTSQDIIITPSGGTFHLYAFSNHEIETLSGIVNLNGVAVDEEDDSMTLTWADVGTGTGTGTVTISDPNILNPTVTLTATGTYVLRLTANDGNSNGDDDITIYAVVDDTDPTLASTDIVDDRSGANVPAGTSVTYTVTFDDTNGIDTSTVSNADFSNAGDANATIVSVTPVSSEAFEVEVLPTTAGSLQLQVIAGAVITDNLGNALDTTSAIVDDTTITVNAASDPYAGWASGFGGLSNTDASTDFDNGGLATGLEWVLGGDPTDSSDDRSIVPTADASDANNMTFTFRRVDASEADSNTAIAVEYGSDMAFGSTATHGVDGVTYSVNDDGAGAGIDIVTVTIPKSLAVGGKMFVRLKATVTTP